MRGLHSKFKILKDSLKAHLAKNSAKWKVFLYSIPAMALFAPLAALASAAAPGGGGKVINTIKTVGGAAAGFGKDVAVAGFGGLLQSGIETTGSLAVWIFIANQLSKLFADLFSGIFLFLINFLIGVSQYNSFLGANVVTIGWAVTRDIANMFLVVALLVIAFATILNINSYQASSLLKQFFFSAILVNFSKMICGVLIDASQVVMMTFVSGFAETAGGNFVRLFKIDGWLQLALGTAKSQAPGSGSGAVDSAATFATYVASSDFFSGIATNIFTAIISFIGILAILSLDIILVVRIVTIWFLVVAAPIAFVAKVLPVTKGFSSQWWSAFTKQLIAGPLVAFIVWISLASIAVSDNAFDLTSEARQKDALFAEANNTPSSKGQIAATKISQWENLALFFVPIVIFIMGAKWAVGVAGGAAKSITGFANKKLSGYATGGLRAFQKQAIGKGDFSVMSQAKKGWKGEGGFTTAALGGIGGYALGKMGAPGKAVSTFGSKLVGDRARAEQRDGRKGLANTASKFGFGDLGHKRHDVHNADADADMFRERARKAAAAGKTSEADINNKKAAEAISKVEDKQKDLFKADGQLDDASILKKLRDNTEHGHISEAALTVGKKLIDESYAKKAAIEMSKRKAEWFAERDAKLDEAFKNNASEEDIKKIQEKYKWDTAKNNEVEDSIDREHGGNKLEAARLMTRYTKSKKDADDEIAADDAKRANRSAQIANIKNAKARQDAESAQKKLDRQAEDAALETQKRQKEVEDRAHAELRTAQATIENTYNVTVQNNPGGHAAAQAVMSSDVSGSVLKAKQSGATDAEIKVSMAHAIQLIPPKDRPSFTDSLKRNIGTGNPLASFVDEALAGLEKVKGEAAVRRLNERKYQRDAQGADYSLKDLGGVPGSNGTMQLSPPAIAELVEAISHDPRIVSRFNSSASAHPDVQRAIVHAVSSVDTAKKITKEIAKNLGDKQEVVARVRNLEQALQASTDPAVRMQGTKLEQFI